MGYTHYMHISKPLKLTSIQKDLIQEVLDENKDVLRDWEGIGNPEFTDKILSFNGDETKNHNHETFLVEFNKVKEFSFCKTAGKPYDLAVCKILLILSLSNGFTFSSDGSGENDEGKRILEDAYWPDALLWFTQKGYADTIEKKVYAYLNRNDS